MSKSDSDSSDRYVPTSKRASPTSSPSMKGKSIAVPKDGGSTAEHCTHKLVKAKSKRTRTCKHRDRETSGNCVHCGELLRIFKAEKKAKVECVIDGKQAKRLVYDMNALVYMSTKCIKQQQAMMTPLNMIIKVDPCSFVATRGDVILID